MPVLEKQVENRVIRRTIRHRPMPAGWGEKQKGQGRDGPAPAEAATGCSTQLRRCRPTAANPARPVAKRSRVVGSGTGVILSVSARKVNLEPALNEVVPKSMVR